MGEPDRAPRAARRDSLVANAIAHGMAAPKAKQSPPLGRASGMCRCQRSSKFPSCDRLNSPGARGLLGVVVRLVGWCRGQACAPLVGEAGDGLVGQLGG